MTITNKREPMSLQNIQEVCSSAFTLASAPNVSNNYTHIPTSQVIEDMIELGWTPVSAQEVRARKGRGYQKHIIRFQNQNIMIKGNDGDDVFPELLLTNSHDGKNTFTFTAGLFRMICENGLVISTQEFENMKIRHYGYDFTELQTVINTMVEALPLAVESMNRFKQTQLAQEQILDFARKAVQIRFGEE